MKKNLWAVGLAMALIIAMAGCSSNGGGSDPAAGTVNISCMDINTTGQCTKTVAAANGFLHWMPNFIPTAMAETTTTTTIFHSGTFILNAGSYKLPILSANVTNDTDTSFDGYFLTLINPGGFNIGWCIGTLPTLQPQGIYPFQIDSAYVIGIPLNIELSQTVEIYARNGEQFPFSPPATLACVTNGDTQGYYDWKAAHDTAAPVALGINYFTYTQ